MVYVVSYSFLPHWVPIPICIYDIIIIILYYIGSTHSAIYNDLYHFLHSAVLLL